MKVQANLNEACLNRESNKLVPGHLLHLLQNVLFYFVLNMFHLNGNELLAHRIPTHAGFPSIRVPLQRGSISEHGG